MGHLKPYPAPLWSYWEISLSVELELLSELLRVFIREFLRVHSNCNPWIGKTGNALLCQTTGMILTSHRGNLLCLHVFLHHCGRWMCWTWNSGRGKIQHCAQNEEWWGKWQSLREKIHFNNSLGMDGSYRYFGFYVFVTCLWEACCIVHCHFLKWFPLCWLTLAGGDRC